MSVVILRGDAASLPLPDASVDLIVCSPPYWGLRSYSDAGEHYAGQIGSEETPGEYIAALLDCTREWMRVLKPQGSIFVNLGDKYAQRPGQFGPQGLTGARATRRQAQGYAAVAASREVDYGTASPKSLLGLPWRYAIGCTDDLGLILRAEIVWCLSGGARVYARMPGGDRPVMLRDLVRSYRPEDVQLWNGERWTQVLGWNRSPDRDGALELELRTGERIGCTPGHRWPTQRGIIRADEIRVGDVIQTTCLPEPEAPAVPAGLSDDDIGWLVGLYLAEGSCSERTLQFSGHVREDARHARLSRIAAAYHGTAAVYRTSDNGVTCNLTGAVLVGIIDHYVGLGRTAATKRLRKSAWQRSDRFLAAIVEGYLSGDGHYDAKNDRWRLGFTANDEWAADLRTLAARLSAKLSLRRHDHQYNGGRYPGWRGEWRWTRSAHPRAKQDGEVVAIRASRAREFYDVGVADEPHLFALASGVLTHNSKPNGLPESVNDRVRRSHEQVFHFTKQPRYFAAVDEIREAHTMRPQRRPNGRPEDLTPRQGQPRQAWSTARRDDIGVDGHPLGKLPGSVWEIPSQPLAVPARLGVDHFACVDAETEVLTRRGWLRHNQLRIGDEIAGFDLDAGAARWTACHGVNVYDYDRELVAVDKPRALSMRLTPNHRTIVHKGIGVHHRMSDPFVIEAADLGPKHFIPRSATWLDPDQGTKGIGRDLAELCGWIAAEGWYGTNKVNLSQSATANPEHVAEIDALLQRLASFWDGPGGERNVGTYRGYWRATVQAGGVIRRESFKTETEARAAAAEWRQELGLDTTLRTERARLYSRASRPWTDVEWRLSPRLGAEIRRLMPDKRLTWDLANLPADEARALLEAFISGDGHTRNDGRISIFQAAANKVTMDVLQAIAVRLGYKTNLSLSGGRWVLYLTAGGRPLTLRGANGSHPPVGREHYKGIVWCPTTGTGTFIARRNGSVFVTGNSFPMELPRRIILGWSPSGICTECGEGRRPVTVKSATGRVEDPSSWSETVAYFPAEGRAPIAKTKFQRGVTATITGYACACPDAAAPARPAVVLDPFGGTGTTALVASVFGRNGVTVDRSADYCRIAQWRTADPGERARALGVPKPPPVPDGQGSLFDALGGEAS